MVGMAGAALRRAQDVYEWLARRHQEHVGAESALDAIRSACGSVPLGGSDGSRAATPLKTEGGDEESAFWQIVLTCCDLPTSASVEQRRAALQELATTLEKTKPGPKQCGDGKVRSFTWQAVAAIRDQYYAERRAFFLVRIELLRVALFVEPEAHPNFDVVEEVVDDLLKEGLLDALFDEFTGRQQSIANRPNFFDLPGQTAEISYHQQVAQQAWEVQYLEEEALLRQLLLLALYISKEKVDFRKAIQTTKAFHNWDDCVVPDAFTSSVLALPRARERLDEARELGVMASIRMLHQVSLLPLGAHLWSEVFELSRTFFAGNAYADVSEQDDASQVPESTQGILSLAWASLLAHQYQQHRASVPDADQLEHVLQEALATAERVHSFYHLHNLLRALTFGDTSQDGEHFYPFLQPVAVDVNPTWQLPPISGLRATSKKLRKERQESGAKSYRVAIFQHVGADFLDDVLVSLGYLDNAANLHQLNAMVKLVSPVLSNPKVAEKSLLGEGGTRNGAGHGLAMLIQKSKELLPQSLLPCVRLCTALCSNLEGSAPSPVLRQVLKDFGKQLSVENRSLISPRLLPPDEFLEASDESGKVTCTRSFYYEDDQLAIAVGTVGQIVDSSTDSRIVQWNVDRPDEQSIGLTLWDLIFETMDNFVAQVQSDTLLQTRESDDMETLTSFFEWIVQASHHTEKGKSVIEEIGCRWTEARLRKWWTDRHLPSPQDVLPLLFSQQVSLAALQDASREDLVAWGIRDRYIREQVLAQLTPTASLNLPSRSRKASEGSSAPFEFDGFTHLIRLLFGFLDSFLHDRRAEEDASWSLKQFHFVSAILGALSALTSLDSCLDIIVEELGGGTEECVNLILKTSRKLFEYHERVSGNYPVVLSTLEIVMNLVRWFLSREARAVDHGSSAHDVGGRDFVAAERNWFVGAVEFAVEILSTHESWKFTSIASKWELTDRCFRVIFALLSAKFVPDGNSMLQGLQAALRKTMVTDVTLMMKLLRSTCGIASTRQNQLKNWNSIAVNDANMDGEDFVLPQTITRSSSPDSSARVEEGLYPLSFESEMNLPVDLERLESLAITALRLIHLLVNTDDDSSAVTDSKASALLLLTPIDDGGPKARKPLNLVTLCGGYLGYPVQKRREVVFWSLKILKHASVFLERSGTSVLDRSSHSLAALFQGKKDMGLVRDAMLRLVRSSLDEIMVGKELLAFLTTCLEHQPGFLAYVLFDVESDSESDKKPVKTQRLVALIERFLVASEQLMEEATDLFCEVLNFLLQAWKGATRHSLAVHVQIVDGLRSSSNFWHNLTRALKIRMSLEHDGDQVAMDMGLAGDDERSLAHAYIGRSSPYGYLARGYILQIVAYEWHYKGSKLAAHPLTQVLETFRTEGLYSHWLRTFTRLDYSQSRFAQVCSHVQHYAKQTQDIITGLDARSDVPSYQDGLICDTSVLQWQLQLSTGSGHGLGSAVLKRAKWCNLQSAYVQAQCFSLARWKVFMELCCLQPGDSSDSSSSGSPQEPSEPTQSPAVNRFKRKESMISSPPRLSTKRMVPPSPLDLGVGAKTSSFSGDRTSYGMIQVLSDIIFARQKGEGESSLDLFGLEHLHHIVELLVSMLHHQLCLVLQKTHDPKLSQTRQRQQAAESRLTVQKSFSLLRLVEKSAQNVELSLEKIKGDFDVETTMDGEQTGNQLFWKRLAGDFLSKVDAVGVRLRTSLLTASLLLVRHIVTVQIDEPDRLRRAGLRESSEGAVDPQESAILQVKLVHHCMKSIRLCDQQQDSSVLRELFQVSWSLFQEILDGFAHTTTVAAASASLDRRMRLDSAVTLRPLIMLLEHEQHGLAALFDILIQRFRVKTKKSAGDNGARVKQEQALHVLSGLSAVVWNAKNRDLCRRVLVDGAELRLLPLLATQLVPLLRAQMEQEETAAAGGTGFHGYTVTDEGICERSIAHQMWCALLGFAAGLLKLLSANDQPRFSDSSSGSGSGVWELLARGEELMLAALHPQTRLTRARIEEQEATLRFLDAVSGVDATKRQWKQGLPRNFALLMEQSRLLLRRACVLLGSSLSETKKLQHKKSVSSRSVVGLATSPLASLAKAASVSAFSFSHQTLLHEHLQAVQPSEKRHLTAFYRSMERELAESVRQASALLLKWTAGLTARESMVVVDGVRLIDHEQLLPLLTFTPPTQAASMSCEPSLGHLCLAMDFLVDQLESGEARGDARGDKENETSAGKQSQQQHASAAGAFGNTVDVCGLLFLKTYLLHMEQFEYPKSDAEDLKEFFQRLNERIGKLEQEEDKARVDRKLFQVIEQIVKA